MMISGVDESAIIADETGALVQRLANRKASAVSERIHGDALILGCDSLLEFGGQTFGKPKSVEEAVSRLLEAQPGATVLHRDLESHDRFHQHPIRVANEFRVQ